LCWDTSKTTYDSDNDSVYQQGLLTLSVYLALNQLENHRTKPWDNVKHSKWFTLGCKFRSNDSLSADIECTILKTPHKAHHISEPVEHCIVNADTRNNGH